MLEILKRIQADVSTVRADVSDVKADGVALKGCLDKLEALVRKQGRDSAAMLVMMRGTVGIYDERMKVIEEDVRLLMERD
jgi:N-methylhydantoinase B/oxoprolinase/acetone carboxylase alpha subunit